ncbi:polysaccharide deacetylase [Chromatiales bacterium (ex Bugula neritina AB1)]|nr:polysaccharide deacetylase [Chromatiales bacterium (ex Bugula neritina AB1)]
MNQKKAGRANAMTVDVEDYFQVSAFDPYISRQSWKNYEGRVESNTDRILQLFDQFDVQATFFTLGWVAQKYPAMVKRIVDQGHDLASHGWDHRRVTTLSRKEFSEDIAKAKVTLEDVSSTPITGYRAPSYSFTLQNDWAHDVLLEQGYHYSSSIAPIKHDLYGIPDAPRFAHICANGGILELPITTTRLHNKNYPCGGGGWFRLYPYAVSKWAINRVNARDNESVIFYFHPWEIDPEQPRVSGLNLTTRFRHYQNLASMEGKIARLLDDYKWRTIPEVFSNDLANVTQN